ncbi:MAG: addiction module protein [Gammaproteobacteria bacterium]|nr:addiction module protein [Gammaproteobacteria bacterium]
MTRQIKELEREIRALSEEEKIELLRALVDELDAPADLDVERAWLETSQRRYRELVEGQVEGIPGPEVFQRLRDRLGG